MKKLLLLVAIAIVVLGCTKDGLQPKVGDMCNIKKHIFSKGAYQPSQPVKVDSVYISNVPSSLGDVYCTATDQKNIVWYIPSEDLIVISR
jgi:hypothetical protein